MVDLIGWVQQGVSNAINTVYNTGQQAVSNVGNTIGNVVNSGTQIANQGGTLIGNTINQGSGYISSSYNQGVQQVQNTVSGLQYTAVNAGGVVGTTIQGVQSIPSMAMTGMGTIGSGVGSGIQTLNTQILGFTGMGAQGLQQAPTGQPVQQMSIPNAPFMVGDQAIGLMNSVNPASQANTGITLYVPYGDRAQTEVNNINKVVIDPISGAFAAYTTPYGHSISNIATSGGAGSLQSGMFSTKPETPIVYTQEGTFNKVYAPTAHLEEAEAVLANPSAFSRLGAEAYGGLVTLLDDPGGTGRTLGTAAMGVYPADTGNLANLVSPTGVNQSKTTWAEVPWSVPISTTPGFFTVDKAGTLTGLNTTQLSSIGITPPAPTLSLDGPGPDLAPAKEMGLLQRADMWLLGLTGMGAQGIEQTGPIGPAPGASLQSNVKGEYAGPTMFSGGLLGYWAFGDKSPEVIKGAVFSGVDSAVGFFLPGTTIFKQHMTETDPALVNWRAENEINKVKMSAPEYNAFLQQSFDQGILTKPTTSPTFVENPRLTYGYGEFSKWSTGAGDTFRNTLLGGATVAQVEQNLYNAERSGDILKSFVAGTGRTMSIDPGQFVSGYVGGALLVGGGEIIGGLWEGSALATRAGTYALAHPTTARIIGGAIEYGIPFIMAAGIAYGASEGFTASPARTAGNLGQMLPEFTGVMLGGASAYGAVRAMDAGYLGYVTKEEKALMVRPTTEVGTFDPLSSMERVAPRPMEIPVQGERVGNTVYFEGWERSPLMRERGGARASKLSDIILQKPTPEYMKPLGETTVSTDAGAPRPDWSRAVLREEPVATSPPPSWMDVRTAGQTIPEARPLMGDVTDLPSISIKGPERFVPPEMGAPAEIRGSTGQTSIMKPEMTPPLENIPVLDLTAKIETAIKPQGGIRISRFKQQARIDKNLYWSSDNPMKLRKGYDRHNTNIKPTAPSAEGAGNWLNRQTTPEELGGYLRIALMERTEPISFKIEAKDTGVMYGPDLPLSVRQNIEAKLSLGERPELASLQPITWEDRVAIAQGRERFGLGAEELKPKRATERVPAIEEAEATKPIGVSIAGIDTGVISVPEKINIPVVETFKLTTSEQERPYAPYVPRDVVNVPRMREVPYIEPDRPYRERPIGDGIITPDKPVPERPIATTDIIPERPVPERPYVPVDKPPNVPVPPIPIIPIPPLPKLPWLPGGGGGATGGIKGPRYKQVETFYLGPKNLKGLMKRKK